MTIDEFLEIVRELTLQSYASKARVRELEREAARPTTAALDRIIYGSGYQTGLDAKLERLEAAREAAVKDKERANEARRFLEKLLDRLFDPLAGNVIFFRYGVAMEWAEIMHCMDRSRSGIYRIKVRALERLREVAPDIEESADGWRIIGDFGDRAKGE